LFSLILNFAEGVYIYGTKEHYNKKGQKTLLNQALARVPLQWNMAEHAEQ
jgi:hypothetical protein